MWSRDVVCYLWKGPKRQGWHCSCIPGMGMTPPGQGTWHSSTFLVTCCGSNGRPNHHWITVGRESWRWQFESLLQHLFMASCLMLQVILPTHNIVIVKSVAVIFPFPLCVNRFLTVYMICLSVGHSFVEDLELANLMGSLGLPVSFSTSGQCSHNVMPCYCSPTGSIA